MSRAAAALGGVGGGRPRSPPRGGVGGPGPSSPRCLLGGAALGGGSPAAPRGWGLGGTGSVAGRGRSSCVPRFPFSPPRPRPGVLSSPAPPAPPVCLVVGLPGGARGGPRVSRVDGSARWWSCRACGAVASGPGLPRRWWWRRRAVSGGCVPCLRRLRRARLEPPGPPSVVRGRGGRARGWLLASSAPCGARPPSQPLPCLAVPRAHGGPRLPLPPASATCVLVLASPLASLAPGT